MKRLVSYVTFSSLLLLGLAPQVTGQTFEIGGAQSKEPAKAASPNAKKSTAGARTPAPVETGIGWGSSIEVGRMARAAEDALRRGNPSQAATFAERAVKQAPNNAKLWFLLGYTSRLAGRYGQSVDAYRQGLAKEGSSPEGLSGLAQTYGRMGRTEEAKRLLMQVIKANPKRQNDLLIAGELFMKSGDVQGGINLLSRAEALKPSSHVELMLAVGYLKLKQPAKAKQFLESAKRRDAKNPAVFRAVANYYREEHDYKSAITTLKSAPRQTPELLADLGYSYELNRDKQEAANTYSKAANSAPTQIGLQLSAAQAQMRVGSLDKARAFVSKAAALDSTHYRLHALQAALAKIENRPLDAIREYNQALSRLPQGGAPEGQMYPISLRLNLSELYREQGDDANAQRQIALAEQDINKLNVEGTARAEFLRVRASVRSNAGDIKGAEADLQEARKLDPANTNIILQYANLLWRAKRRDEARKLYTSILDNDRNNRFALEALGYLSRDEGDNKGAEYYFNKLAAAYPTDYVAYLALGDLYTSTRDFARADGSYQKAHKLAPANSVIVANAANAAIEARQIPLAAEWVSRANGKMKDDPRVMREQERVFFHQGKFLESAQIGERVLEKLPKDRNASVYLAYALYNLGRYDDVLALSQRYENVLPREANFPLLTGHVHKQSQLLYQAVDDYTRAIEHDPRMTDAYINRGYSLNDMQNAEQAVSDFQSALKLSPNNGVAHLGLAFSNLQLRRGRTALDEVDTAERLLGESGATHLARATAFRQQRLLERAEKEYQTALKFAPDDAKLYLALADTQYHLRRYGQSLTTLIDALRYMPDDPMIYAQMAHAHAQLKHRQETLQYVATAERAAPEQAAIYLNTGDALLVLGDREGAMERFARALQAPDSNRVDARLAIAKVFVRDREFEDARQQVSLGFAESRIGEAAPVTADNLVEAANLFLAMNDFDLAAKYFETARNAGAADQVVAIGMANAYLAQGDPLNAQAQLASLGNPDDYAENYDYTLAMATVHRQRRDSLRALSMFARANMLSGQDEIAERQLQEVAGEEGLRLTRKVSVGTDFTMNGIFEDATIYNLDRQLFHADANTLPTPRSSLESRWTNTFKVHQDGVPTISGFVQVRNARGEVSIPSEALILNRDLYDYSANGALNPVLRFGRNVVAFNTGLQYTWRRDKRSAFELNQNLFRQFAYMSTNSFWNWISVRGSAFHESGPFTERNLSSRELGAKLEFIVGRPWGRTSLITSYAVRDLQFNPLIREFFSTTTSVGVQRQFGTKSKAALIGEYIRSWRAQAGQSWIAQAMRPAAEFEYRANNRWTVSGTFAFSRGQGFHDYDNVQSSLLISYVRPFRRNYNDGTGELPVEYPLRISFGIQNANFMNFTGRDQAIIRPVVRLSLF
ncbi:MAG TPA: tetratricopeptide repeat protein [Clostridia bacterium]|nr:tetratricopeptide repeat protein [Clostridia bacterium]